MKKKLFTVAALCIAALVPVVLTTGSFFLINRPEPPKHLV